MILQNNTFIKQGEMTTFKITPDFAVSNSKNEIITNSFTNVYKPPIQRFSLGSLSYTKPNRIYFNIVLKNNNTSFYLTVPRDYEDLVQGKMSSCWKKSGIDKVEDNSFLKLPIKSTVGGELFLKDYNFKAISTGLSDTSHLNSLFQLLKVMKSEDKIIINVAIEPMTRNNWINVSQEEIKKEREGIPKFDSESLKQYVVQKSLEGATSLIDMYLELRLLPVQVLLGLFGDSNSDKDDLRINSSKERESSTGRNSVSTLKRNSDVAKCKITILSSSPDTTRANIHLLSVAETFKELNDENEFVFKPLNDKWTRLRISEVKSHSVAPNNHCILSTREMAKLLQLPPKQTQRDYKIKAIDELEGEISRELFKGDVPIAITKIRGKEHIIYRSNDKSTRCLPYILIGGQNVGKTTLMKRIAYENYKFGDANLIIDTIEDCKIAKACRELIPDDKRVDIKVSMNNTKDIPSFSFNEVSNLITEDMDKFTRLSLASNIAEQVELIIGNVSNDTPLTDAMIRYLYSACLVTFIRPRATLKDVFDVLRIPDERHKAIWYAQASNCFDDESIFYNLYQLDKEVKVKELQTDENGKEKEVSVTRIVNNDQAIVGINNIIQSYHAHA